MKAPEHPVGHLRQLGPAEIAAYELGWAPKARLVRRAKLRGLLLDVDQIR